MLKLSGDVWFSCTISLDEVVLHFVVKYRVFSWDTVPEYNTKVVNILKTSTQPILNVSLIIFLAMLKGKVKYTKYIAIGFI